MTSTTSDPPQSPQTTDLERRVLAHERILQSLIAYMARTEPRFVDHLRERFVDSMAMARREHDYRDVDDYAEEFIRAVMHIGTAPHRHEAQGAAPAAETTGTPDLQGGPVDLPERVQIKESGGIWEVRVDGAFRGDYRRKEHALAAAALAKLSLR